jgi:hypothetical protein
MYIDCSDGDNDCYVDDILLSGEFSHFEIINNAIFGMIISLMHDYPMINPLYNKKSQQLITQKDKILLWKEQILAIFHTTKMKNILNNAQAYMWNFGWRNKVL